MEVYGKKRKFREKYRIFKTNAKCYRKRSENSSKKTKILRTQDSFSKRDLSASPIDGLTQNINLDLRTTRRQFIN